MKQYYIYILTNRYNTVLYVGVTNDLLRRIYEHKNKIMDGFTKKYNLSKLVYFEICSDSLVAIQREKTIKNLLRRKKEELISKRNPEWNDLYAEILSG